MKNKAYLIFTTGFALFCMFFGSGNLVFPLLAGQGNTGALLFASLGFLLTAVVVPFLGVFAMLLYKGDLNSFFSCFGKKTVFWFSLFALAIMGPFGVLARCLTVAHGSLETLFPGMSLPFTSMVLCAVLFFVAAKKSKIISLLGTILTPLLLLSLVVVAFFGLSDGSWPKPLNRTGWEAMKLSFFQGYQTMDLLAAFFFSTFIIKQLQKLTKTSHDDQSALAVFIRASFVAASVLSLVYVALILLGAKHSAIISDVPPQLMLGTIALKVLGPMSAPIIALAVMLACLTTAVVLAVLFADFLRVNVCSNKLSNNQALLITLAISFLVSTLDFVGIAQILGPILETIYPALIALTIVNIIHKLFGTSRSHWPVTVTLAAKLCI